jgi:ABC-type polysaccharide/polyol phosphate export permease
MNFFRNPWAIILLLVIVLVVLALLIGLGVLIGLIARRRPPQAPVVSTEPARDHPRDR